MLLAKPLQQPRVGQHLQMPRDARLALADDFADLADRQLTPGEQSQQPQSRGLSNGAEGGYGR
jgi:hypothetical protein